MSAVLIPIALILFSFACLVLGIATCIAAGTVIPDVHEPGRYDR